jgi:alginate O-acetyltransferase complex protein AlgI
MLFNSYEFMFLFFPIVLVGYYVFLRTNRSRLILLTLLSYVFYGWWDYRFCGLMFLSTCIDYFGGTAIHRSRTDRMRKFCIVATLAANLSLLGFFKYFDLFAESINRMAGLFEGTSVQIVPLLHVILPVGISFYTFHSMSYSIDIYRRVIKPAPTFWNLACFVALFPQLVAGPIIRYKDLAEQLIERTHSIEKAALGIVFFVMGLVKKVIIADGVAPLVGQVFGMSAPGFAAAWSGVLAYAVQIYFDFSGYSDMAVGLGLILGFQVPQNFNSPYKAVSISDFWRRWHMSLSTWLRDYLYISFGGNRLGEMRTYVNLFLTMLLGGLWHGANWTFVLWGGYHGLLLAFERATGRRTLFWWAPMWIQKAATFCLVLFGWVLFRCPSMERAGAMFSGMFGVRGVDVGFWARAGANPIPWILLVTGLLIAWASPNTWEIRWKPSFGLAVVLAVLFVACLATILINTSSPFLYFQF